MADTFELTDGTTTVDLVYNSSSQPNYKLRSERDFPTTRIAGGEPRAIWHEPSDYPRELIEIIDDVKVANFQVAVLQDDSIDDVFNAIIKMERLLQQAKRYNTHGDVDRVTLKVQLENATNATLWPIVYGWSDYGQALYTSAARKNEVAQDGALTLYLAPYGEAESNITYDNYLSGSMNTSLFSGGLAHGLTAVGPPSTIQANGANWLAGGTSQQIITDASSAHGVYATMTAPMGSSGRAFVWIHAVAGGDPITIELRDGSSNLIQEVEFDVSSPAGYDDTRMGNGSSPGTWYKYSVFGTNSSAADFRVRVVRRSTDATTATTFNVDLFYGQRGGTLPDYGWTGPRAIDNRGDVDTSNVDRINYIDVWGIPGDAPALVDITLDWTTIGVSPDTVVVGRAVDGRILAAERRSLVDSDEFSVDSVSGGSWSAGTGTMKNHYRRLTQDGSGTAGNGSLVVTISGDDARKLLAHPVRVFGICQADVADCWMQLRIYNSTSGFGDFFTSETIEPGQTGDWVALDMGLVNLQGVMTLDPVDSSEPDMVLQVNVHVPASSSGNGDFDGLLFVPTDPFMVAKYVSAFTTSNEASIRGHYEDIILDTYGLSEPAQLGSMWELAPGNQSNRLQFLVFYGPTGRFRIADASSVTLTVTPRTRHLLGTL